MKAKIHVILITIAILLFNCFPVLAEEYTASTMRLLRHEGTVKIEDSSGKQRDVLENVRFSSGESMTTGVESIASVGLDSDKVVTMDQLSRVEFSKNNRNMEMTLKSGQILLDVQKKLSQEEKLDVRTSTMVIGIRGTIIDVMTSPVEQTSLSTAVSKLPAGTTYLSVLEGTAEVSYSDTSGNRQSVSVPAGQLLSITDADSDGKADAAPVMRDLEISDFNEFMLRLINGDTDLKERVSKEISFFEEALCQVDEKIYETEITLVAQSASKIFDGKELTRRGDVLVYGLPEYFTIDVQASGSITDAGTAENPIGNYKIYNAASEDVTSRFKNIKTVSGKLVVDPAPLTVWTGSAEKVYDGKPLTCQDAKLGNYPVHQEGVPKWRNLSYVALGQEQSFEVQTLYGICGTVYVRGTNPLTGENQEIELKAGQKLTVWLSDQDDQKSIEYTITNVKEDELPDEVLWIYADNPDLLSQACRDADWNLETMKNLIEALKSSERNVENMSLSSQTAGTSSSQGSMQYMTAKGTSSAGGLHFMTTGSGIPAATYSNSTGKAPSVTRLDADAATDEKESSEHVIRYDLDIRKDRADSLIRDIADVRINIDTTITDYNGRPLSSAESRFSEVYVDDSITVTVTGSQTAVGESQNSYVINWGTAKPANYVISEKLGTLKVTAASNPVRPRRNTEQEQTPTPAYDNNIVLTAASKSKVYDGTALSDHTVTATGLPNGYTFAASTNGVQQAAGSSPNRITSYKIYDESGADVTSRFTNITLNNGTLTVEKAPATVTTGSASRTYDGTSLTNEEASIEGLISGESASVKATGKITDAGSETNTYEIDWGTTNPNNYELTENLGTLTMTPLPVTFIAICYETSYNGFPHLPETVSGIYEDGTDVDAEDIYYTGDGVTAAGIYALFNLTGGGQVLLEADAPKNAGSHAFTPTATFKKGKASNYSISYEGTMEISKASLTVTTGSAKAIYNGTPLTSDEIYLVGLAEPDEGKVTASATGSITEVGYVTNSYTIDWGSADEKNYVVTENLGTLSVLPTGSSLIGAGEPLSDASAALAGINVLATDTVASLLNYSVPVVPGTPVRHIDWTDSSEEGIAIPDPSDSTNDQTETSDDSVIPDSPAQPDTNTADAAASGPSAGPTPKEEPITADSSISELGTHAIPESGIASVTSEDTDSSIATQAHSDNSGAEEADSSSSAETEADTHTASTAETEADTHTPSSADSGVSTSSLPVPGDE